MSSVPPWYPVFCEILAPRLLLLAAADALCLVREGALELYRIVDAETSHLFPTGASEGAVLPGGRLCLVVDIVLPSCPAAAGKFEWRVESRKRPVLVHVAKTPAHNWVGYEALGWLTLLQVRPGVRAD